MEESPGHSGSRGSFDSRYALAEICLPPGKYAYWNIRCALQHAQDDRITFVNYF